jgi:hypothetical protein
MREEWKQPTFGLLRWLRLGIVASRLVSPTVLVDELVGGTKRSTVGVSRELMYYIPRDFFFLLALLTSLHGSRLVAWCVILLVLDMLGNLAGGTLIWWQDSLSQQRSFVLAMVNYFEICVAFAVLHLHFNCLSVKPLSASQALYFSFVTATTLGSADMGPAALLGRVLVICQLGVFVVFVVAFLNILRSSSGVPEKRRFPLSDREVAQDVG